MSETLLKHSRMPRKYEPKEVTVDKLESTQGDGLAGVDPKILLKRYFSDESTNDIAASYGVTRQALGQYLLRHAETDWKEAQVARAIARKEKAEDDLEVAADPLALARARELLKAAQWDLERVCRRIYGEDKAQAVIVTPVLNINLSEDQARDAIEHLSIAHARAGQVIEAPQQSTAALSDKDA